MSYGQCAYTLQDSCLFRDIDLKGNLDYPMVSRKYAHIIRFLVYFKKIRFSYANQDYIGTKRIRWLYGNCAFVAGVY